MNEMADARPSQLNAHEQTELNRLVREAVWQARDAVAEFEGNGKFISRHHQFPRLDHFDSGQPHVVFQDGPMRSPSPRSLRH